ncbi:hypothetical protein SAMN05216600_116112 [Pseudomonas cuatrocienegasensis]|uniref:Uncharacterized protein n=1 Tax=Pseudomonas cuatrocienegasensis TaxID=543360 RepID=A0ABY1BM73_9PSED|nr:hypothetical protein SAMN05216600_116112 [Pseudomonas cuatrocienegasensis]
MTNSLSKPARELLRLLTVLRVSRALDSTSTYGLSVGRCWGFIAALRESGLICHDVASRLDRLVSSAMEHAGQPFPHATNAGPVMPLSVALERRVPQGKPQAQVSSHEPKPLPPPTAPTGLRLLCLRVETVSGQTRLLPVHTLHPMPPRNRHHGKWGSDRYACFVLRETQARPATAEVLVRCARHRQTHALRPALGSVRVGGLSHV